MIEIENSTKIKNKIIYVYSTESLKYPKTLHKPKEDGGDVHFKPWFKIGMTTQESAEDRIAQQDRTSNPEPLIKLYDLDLIKEGHINVNAYDIEQKIHKYYDRRGLRVRNLREWFEAGSVEEIKLVIESILNDSDLHKQEISLKHHQIEADKKIDESFVNGEKKCLLAHKPRSGKTFITIHNIKKNNYKNVIVLTSYPILNYQWEDTIRDFKGFSDTNIIIGSGLSKIELDDSKKNILLLSLQDAKGGDEIFSKEKFDSIRKITWDLMVIDEVHYGVETQKTKELLDKIKYERLLGLSATPTKNLICGTFDRDKIHTYSLVEECILKKKYPKEYPYADISFYLWNLTPKERSELKYFSDEDQFTFEKFFRIEGGEFYYKNDIIFLFKKLIGSRDICGRDKLGTEYPFKNNGKFNSVKSILLFLPKIEVQEKLKNLLETIDVYKEDFNIHITNSEINSSKNLMKKIKRDFKSKTDKRSFIMAVDQLTTGITLEDCDMVAFMNDWRSVDKYIQASFRCQSPREGKENCFVVDFNAARNFEMIWEYNNILSKNNGKGLEQTLREWIESVNIFNRVDGELKKIDFDSFSQEYNKIISERPRFNYSSVIFDDKLKDDQIKRALGSIGISGCTSKTNEDLDDDGIDKGKSKKGKGKNGKGKKDVPEISDAKIMEIAKALVDKTMLLTIFTDFKFDKVDDCFNALIKDNRVVPGIGELRRTMFMDTLLLGMNDVDKVDLSVVKFIYDNIYDKNIIDKKLYIFNQKVKLIYNSIRENPECISIMLPNLVELIDSYLKPSTTEKELLGEVFTPLYNVAGCVDDQLSNIDNSFWSNKNVKVLDPCCGIGNYPVVLVGKFMNGLVSEFPDTEERLKWILENIIYINEYQSKNLFIYLQLFNPTGKFKLNYHKGDFLTLDIEKVFGVDKFDLVCTNPPYNRSHTGDGTNSGSIYHEFILKAMLISDNSLFIIPLKWSNNSYYDFREKLINYGIDKLVILRDGDKLFSTSGVGEVCFLKLKRGNKKLEIIENENNFMVDIDKYRGIYLNGFVFDSVSLSILNKITSKHRVFMSDYYNNPQLIKTNLLPKTKKISSGVGKNYLIRKSKGGDETLNFLIDNDCLFRLKIDEFKICFEKIYGGYKSGKLSNIEILKPGHITTEGISFFSTSDINIALNIKSYLLTNFAQYLRMIRQYDRSFTSMVFSYVPYMDFSKNWTDENLFEYFQLTEEEKNIVLNYDKK